VVTPALHLPLVTHSLSFGTESNCRYGHSTFLRSRILGFVDNVLFWFPCSLFTVQVHRLSPTSPLQPEFTPCNLVELAAPTRMYLAGCRLNCARTLTLVHTPLPILFCAGWPGASVSPYGGSWGQTENQCLLVTPRRHPNRAFLGPLEGTELGFTALRWAPLGWRQLRTYKHVLRYLCIDHSHRQSLFFK
jgi:hypothetical protein